MQKKPQKTNKQTKKKWFWLNFYAKPCAFFSRIKSINKKKILMVRIGLFCLL